MAIARLSMKVGRGGQACSHAAYIAREGRYAHRLEQGEKLEAVEAGNMPAWAKHDPLLFWQAADAHERSNGTTYREMEIALLRELDAGERIALVQAFVAQEIGSRHAYQWAIHTPVAIDGKEQPHVHLMFSERQADGIERDPEQYFRRYNAKSPEKGGARKGYGPHAGQTLSRQERAADLKELRSRWQEMANRHLEQLGHSTRIDMRSHAERGTGLEPEKKQLPSQWRGAGKENVIEFRQARAELLQAHEHMQQAVPDAKAEIISLEAERERRAAAQRQAEQRQREQERAEWMEARRVARELIDERRINRMTSSELRAEIERMRPPEVKTVVDSHPEVVAAREAHAALSQEMKQAEGVMKAAKEKIEAWREAHPLRAKMHDLGLVSSKFLMQQEEKRQAAWTRSHELFPKFRDAKFRAEYTEVDIEGRTQLAQLPVRERMAELEQKYAQKVVQERAERRQEHAIDQVERAFKGMAARRQARAHGWGDEGAHWKGISETLRKSIETYNRMPAEAKTEALKKLREDMKRDRQGLEQFIKERSATRGGGRSRGGSSEREMRLKRSQDRGQDQEWEL